MKKNHVLGGALIVSGTSIGAGALAIPVATSLGGFLPAFIYYILTWLFATCTGLLFLELALKLPKDANLISMSEKYLGLWGKMITWGIYLFLFYSLLIAYISGGGDLIRHWTGELFERHISYLVFFFLFAPIVYLGIKIVDRMNILLMIGLVLSYFLFLALSVQQVQLQYLSLVDWKQATLALPIIFAAFGYQSVIPSLASYLNKDAKRLRYAIVLGTTITFVIYVIWEALILGIVPVEGVDGLARAKELGLSAIQPLSNFIDAKTVLVISNVFAFCAVTTSFLGVALGLSDFLADGFSLKKGKHKLLIASLTFLPPLIFAMTKPGLFLIAFQYAGGVGVSILLGLFPVLMVWSSRFVQKDREMMQLGGGRFVLILLILFVLLTLSTQVVYEYLRLGF